VVNVLTGQVTELLRQMITNKCVNDGSDASGQEQRNVDALSATLEGPGIDLETYEPLPGRSSLVARIEGASRDAPSLMLLGHTDVVPANDQDWRHDPFGGELIDGEVWGRGAVDMLNLTSSMAVAFRRLADDGFRPRGDLVFVGVADEEALGTHGAKWLTDNLSEYVRTDYLVTEAGGFPTGSGAPSLPVLTAEKGVWWCDIYVRGTPGHASQPHRTDNALVKAAEVVRRLASHRIPAEIHDQWRQFVEGIGLPEEVVRELADSERIEQLLEHLPEVGLARFAHSCTHTTLAPTVMTAGTKLNVIPDRVELQVDIRVLPGWGKEEVDAMLQDALGDLYTEVEVSFQCEELATSSPTDTPLWEAFENVAGRFYPGARCVPFISGGATDARFFRHLGTVAYGFGLFSRNLNMEEYFRMFHGIDERIDVESLGLSAELWDGVARQLLG
jgi:acetylornithine deacetylase/succinyl-diaminopimelate desuccinylase-like protein